MGCFVAVEVATMRPDLANSLLLYEPPFYVGLPNKSTYKIRLAAYFRLYRAVAKQPPYGFKRFVAVQRLIKRLTGFSLPEDSWIPFQRSIQNTILQQTALDDLKKLSVPTKILYGRFDQLVFNDKNNAFFEGSALPIEVGQLPEAHAISQRASKAIAEYIITKTG
jgi:pimeloyl-ACP methyl ester carboxylesterase